MPVDFSDWVIVHFPRYRAGCTPTFRGLYRRRLVYDARVRGWTEADLLTALGEYHDRPPGSAPAPLIRPRR
jgi:hypothetical protein